MGPDPAGNIGLIPTRLWHYMACLQGAALTHMYLTHFGTFMTKIGPLLKAIDRVLCNLSVAWCRKYGNMRDIHFQEFMVW